MNWLVVLALAVCLGVVAATLSWFWWLDRRKSQTFTIYINGDAKQMEEELRKALQQINRLRDK